MEHQNEKKIVIVFLVLSLLPVGAVGYGSDDSESIKEKISNDYDIYECKVIKVYDRREKIYKDVKIVESYMSGDNLYFVGRDTMTRKVNEYEVDDIK